MSRKQRTAGKRVVSTVRTVQLDNTITTSRYHTLVGAFLLVAAVFVAYIPAISGDFIWDDDRYVSDNETLRSPGGLQRIWLEIGGTIQYYPAVFTTFWIEHQLWGLAPAGYHVTNILLHGLSAALLWILLRKLAVPGAWLIAAVFALHPINVESVAWITERKNVLSGLFYILAMNAYLRFEPLVTGEDKQPRRWRFYAAAFVLFILALLSKTVTCSLPAAILLLIYWKRGRFTLRAVLPLVPLFAIGLLLAILTTWMEKNNVRARGSDWELSLVDRFLIAGRALWFYLGKLAWPTRLTFSYPRWQIDAALWWQYVFPLATFVATAALYVLRKRIGRGPLVAALLFGGTLLPALGFINVYPMRYSFVADHFQYLAGIAPVALVVGWLFGLARSRGKDDPGGSTRLTILRVAACAVLVVLAVLTWRQCGIYKNLDTLWRDTLAKNPTSWMAHNNLGALLNQHGHADQAEPHFRAALELKEDFDKAQINLGRLLVERREYQAAIAHFERAVAIKPDLIEAREHLANALLLAGRPAEAIKRFERILAMNTERASAHDGLARALVAASRFSEALEHHRQAVRFDPADATMHMNFANTLARMRRLEEALAEYDKALEIKPQSFQTQLNKGLALVELGRFDQALEHYRRATQLAPESPQALHGLATTLLRAGRVDEALEAFSRLATIDPDNADVRCNVGILLTRQGRLEEAEQAFEAALRINPRHARANRELAALHETPESTGELNTP